MNTTQKRQLKNFLRHLNSNIYVYSGNMIKASLDTVLEQNKKGEDAYFYVNSGGTKEWQITNVNSCFVDLDAGRDTKGKYLTPSKVQIRKRKMLLAIRQCPLKPHYIVETRNGYQLYWCIQKYNMIGKNRNFWNATQYYIKSYFAEWADKRVGKSNQIMRLPNTVWYKKNEYKSSFQTSFHSRPNNLKRYTLSRVYEAFKTINKGTKPVFSNNTSFPKQSGNTKQIIQNVINSLVQLMKVV